MKKKVVKKQKETKQPKVKTKKEVHAELKADVEKAFKFVEEAFNKQEGFSTMIFIDYAWIKPEVESPLVKEGSVALVLGSEGAVAARRQVVASLGAASGLLQLFGLVGAPTGVRIASEAWVGENLKLRPSEDPKRKEALFVSGRAPDGTEIMTGKEIFRGVDGKKGKEKLVVELRPLKQIKTSISEAGDKANNGSLLSLFWEAYNNRLVIQDQMEDLGRFTEMAAIAKANPANTFKYTLKAALEAAVTRHIEEDIAR